MKKILFIALALCLTWSLKAQDTDDYADYTDHTDFSVIPHVGIGVANLTGSSTPFNGQFSYTAGVNVEYRHTPLLGFAAGIEYAAMGGDLKHYPQSIHTGYVAVPLQVLLHLDTKERFVIRGGLVPAFRSHARVKGGGVNVDAANLVRPFDLATNVALDWRFNNNITLGIEARSSWLHALRDYTGSDGQKYMLGDSKLKNTGICINVGYKFNVNKIQLIK